MSIAIETKNLSKHYGAVKAVQDLSLEVEEGEIYAFLGLNGAGKTTTIRMLLGMIRPSQGGATVLGHPVRLGHTRPWAEVGYLVEVPRAYPELSVRDNLEVARRLHPGTPAAAIDEMIELLHLGEYAQRRAGKLSLGNKQRLGLAKALLHKPKLLFLDEPANGLDPAGIVEIRQLLRRLAQEQGITIFMSSHILGEVARLAQRIGIIHQGRLLQEMSLADLERNRKKHLMVRTNQQPVAERALKAAGQPYTTGSNGTLNLSSAQAVEHPEEINRLLVEAGAVPSALLVEEEGLEEYFLRLIGTDGDSGND